MGGSKSADASEKALETNRALAEQYYGIALPALSSRLGSINTALGQGGEPDYLRQAYQAQRTGLTEGIVGKEEQAITSQLAGTKQARAGGNVMSGMSTGDIGAQLANALYGSKFQESMAGVDQTMNLMSMALGGAGTAGSGAVEASRQQLGAIGYMPSYNTAYANVAGGLAGLAGIYGTMNQAGLFNTNSGMGAGWIGPSTVSVGGGSGVIGD